RLAHARVPGEPRGGGRARPAGGAPAARATPKARAGRAGGRARRETGSMNGLRIRVEKRIPVAAGLGGGSTDAAAVLAGFGRLGSRPLGSRRLRAMAVALGVGVPLFLGRGPALAAARGGGAPPGRGGGGRALRRAQPGCP